MVKRCGKSSLSGSGTSAWSWVMCLSQPRYAPPCLLPRSHLRTSRPPRRLLFRGTGRQKSLCAGRAGRFSWRDFALQPDGTLRCAAKQPLVVHERRREADGSLRVVYAASIRSCRPCPLRHQCQWHGQRHHKAASGECAVASIGRRVSPHPLEGLEP